MGRPALLIEGGNLQRRSHEKRKEKDYMDRYMGKTWTLYQRRLQTYEAERQEKVQQVNEEVQ